jgi:Fur family ferric uptake transcriptional regulator
MQRNTSQRKAIQEVFKRNNRPLSPQEVLEKAQKKVPNLGIATVYRTLKQLNDKGELKTVELPGEAQRYEMAGKEHHHHFHCRACGKVYEVEGCPGDMGDLVPDGFDLEDHEVILYGTCAVCCENDSS